MGGLCHPSGDAVKYAIIDLASYCLRNTEACSNQQHHQEYHAHCGLWRNVTHNLRANLAVQSFLPANVLPKGHVSISR